MRNAYIHTCKYVNIRRNIDSWAAIGRVGLYVPVGFIGERAYRGCLRKVGSARLLEEGTTSRGLLEDTRASRGCLEKFGLAVFFGGGRGLLGIAGPLKVGVSRGNRANMG